MHNDELLHVGVKGMKWGIRKTSRTVGAAVKTHLKKATTPSSDHLEYKALRKKKLKNLTNDELKKVLDRKKLEIGYLKSGDILRSKQIKAMSNAELKLAIDRQRLRKVVGLNPSKIIKSFKMSDDEIKSTMRRANLERELNKINMSDYENAKRFVNMVVLASS